MKIGRSHADDGVGFIVQYDLLPDEVRIGAISQLPQRGTADHYASGPSQVFFGQKRSSHSKPSAKEREEAGRGAHGDHRLRLASARQVTPESDQSRHILENLILIAPVKKIGPCDRKIR